MPARKKQSPAKPKPRRKSAQKRNISAIRFSGAFRIVSERQGQVLEIYQNQEEAIASGVPEHIANELFSDIRVAYCWAKIDKRFNLVGCVKRSLNGETCQGECHLFADGEDIGTGAHLWDPGVTYRCKCIE